MEAARSDRFVGIYERLHGRVWAYAARRVGREFADDVAAETFLIAWRKFDQLPVDPTAWLFGVAHNVVLRRFAADAREACVQASLAFEWSHESCDGHDDVDIWRAWASLTERDREVLALIAWDGLKVREAARVVGLKPAVFSVRLHRARKRFERLLDHASPTQDSPASVQTRSEAT